MLVEAELKAVVRDVDAVCAALNRRGSAQVSIYADRYFDYPDHRLTEQGSELRVRRHRPDSGPLDVQAAARGRRQWRQAGARDDREGCGRADTVLTALTS